MFLMMARNAYTVLFSLSEFLNVHMYFYFAIIHIKVIILIILCVQFSDIKYVHIVVATIRTIHLQNYFHLLKLKLLFIFPFLFPQQPPFYFISL